MLNNFPAQLHPMSQFSAAINVLNLGSKFAKAYSDNVPKAKYWEVSVEQNTCFCTITSENTRRAYTKKRVPI
jgi:hypothetical protein